MPDRVATHLTRRPGEEAAIVSAMSAFLQAGFVHFGVGPLARRSAQDLASRIVTWCRNGRGIEIRITDEQVLIDDHAVAGAADAETWLVLALSQCGAGGLCIHPHVDAETLLAFADALRAATQPEAPALGERWQQPGIDVLPPDGGAPSPEEARRVMQQLARSDAARSKLGQLHAAIDLEYAGAERLDSMQMLCAILEQLPDAARRDDRTACEVIERVLDRVIRQLDGFLAARPDAPSERMARLAADFARGQEIGPVPTADDLIEAADEGQDILGGFMFPDAAGSEDAPGFDTGAIDDADDAGDDEGPLDAGQLLERLGRGLVQDVTKPGPADPLAMIDPRRVADNPTALREELRKIPKAKELQLDPELPVLQDEMLGSCLHLLVRARDPDRVELLITPLVDRILASPSPSQRRTLGRYLRFARERGGAHGDAVAVRLIGFLQRHGVDKLMTTRETIDVEQVIQTFPAQFLIWLDALQLRDEDSRQQFRRLCDAVGEVALAEVARVLIDDGTLLTPNRTEKGPEVRWPTGRGGGADAGRDRSELDARPGRELPAATGAATRRGRGARDHPADHTPAHAVSRRPLPRGRERSVRLEDPRLHEPAAAPLHPRLVRSRR